MEQIEALTAAVRELRAEAGELRDALATQAEAQDRQSKAQDRHTKTVRRRLTALAAVVAVFSATGIVGAWLLHQDLAETRRAANDQRVLCLVVTPMVPQPGDAPPATQRGVEVAEGMRELGRRLGC